MVDRVEAQFGIKVPLAVLFTHATLEQFTLAMRDEGLRAQAPLVWRSTPGARGRRSSSCTATSPAADSSASPCPERSDPSGRSDAVHPHGLLDPRIPASIEAMAADRLTALRGERPHGP